MPFVVVYVFFHVLYFIMQRKSVGLIASGATLHAKSIRLASFWMCVRDNRTRSNKYREVAHFPWMLCDFKITIVVTTEQHQHKSLLELNGFRHITQKSINSFEWFRFSHFIFHLHSHPWGNYKRCRDLIWENCAFKSTPNMEKD